ELVDAARYRVAMVLRLLHCLDELRDDVRRRRMVRIAHPEVDDVLAAGACCGLQVPDDVEDVRRQTLDAWKLHATSRRLVSTGFPPRERRGPVVPRAWEDPAADMAWRPAVGRTDRLCTVRAGIACLARRTGLGRKRKSDRQAGNASHPRRAPIGLTR